MPSTYLFTSLQICDAHEMSSLSECSEKSLLQIKQKEGDVIDSHQTLDGLESH